MAAEVISMGVRLDHIPLPVFSCCGWGFVVGQAGRERELEGLRKKEGEEAAVVGGGRKEYGERQAEGGGERWAVPTVLTKAAPVLRP